MSESEVKVKVINRSGMNLPSYAKDGDAGMDIRSTEDVLIKPGETVLVPTGLFVELPAGYAFEVSPRSGLSARTKLRVILGTIDSGYRGEIKVIVDNISTEDFGASGTVGISHSDPKYSGRYLIRRGDKIAQLKLKVTPKCIWEDTEELSETSRGEGGFGHTGLN